MLLGEEHFTASVINPLLNVLRNKVLVASGTDTTLVADIKERICNYLESKYIAGHSNLEDTINIASFLDPSVAWGLARGVYLMALTTQPSLEDYNVVYSVHACAARYNN